MADVFWKTRHEERPSHPNTRTTDRMAASTPENPADTSTTLMPAVRPEAGATIGEFSLIRLLGKGGMAEVWLAEQHSLKRNVALKLLKPELTTDPTYVKRFQAEAKAAGGLTHSNIVQVYSVGQADGRHYIAQEYVQGSTLKSFLQRKGALDLQTALHIMRQAAGALQAAAERGIVHRDIKPENIMLTRKGEVKVADFGLAQLMGGERLNLTQEGTTMGTPLYMSPEQVNGQKLDQRSDIYSFGVTCYHMLAGETPFRGESAIAVAMQHLQNMPRELASRRPDLPRAMCDIVHRMLAKNPDDRYPSAQKVLVDLKKLARTLKDDGVADDIELKLFDPAEPSPSLAMRRPWLVLGLLCALTAGASAAMGWTMRPSIPESTGSDVPKARSAEEQFQWALLKVNDEAYFQAVKENFPEKTNVDFHQLADEQLAFLYLRDVSNLDRKPKILAQLQQLGTYNKESQQKAAIGKAYLEMFSVTPPDKFGAQVTLDTNQLLGPVPSDSPVRRGQWGKYYSEITAILFPERQGADNTPPGGPGNRVPFGGLGGDRNGPRGEDNRPGLGRPGLGFGGRPEPPPGAGGGPPREPPPPRQDGPPPTDGERPFPPGSEGPRPGGMP
ncbi:Serine/threonine-protein kinase PrkC [Caulifigura coniformis]|uniref:non-specific serine/threonine protein kinase n=2 Tax=Caulifigura coniformis TaxID=2527983 RepID=A0A517S907_9PLAN|nr:Serine/threonine-protein kinase PrkC [Caulifigura coniformis]